MLLLDIHIRRDTVIRDGQGVTRNIAANDLLEYAKSLGYRSRRRPTSGSPNSRNAGSHATGTPWMTARWLLLTVLTPLVAGKREAAGF